MHPLSETSSVTPAKRLGPFVHDFNGDGRAEAHGLSLLERPEREAHHGGHERQVVDRPEGRHARAHHVFGDAESESERAPDEREDGDHDEHEVGRHNPILASFAASLARDDERAFAAAEQGSLRRDEQREAVRHVEELVHQEPPRPAAQHLVRGDERRRCAQ